MEEQSVLGAIILNNNVIDDISFLEPTDFSESHQEIYQAMLELAAAGTPIDIRTLSHKMGNKADIIYLTQLADYTPTSENAKYYAQAVKEKSIKRKGILAAHNILSLSEQSYDNIDQYINEVEEEIEAIKPKALRGFKQAKYGMAEVVDSILEPVKHGIKTGFPRLDNFMKGLGRGWLIVIGARPSVGKTAFVIQIADYIAWKHGAVGFFEMEMEDLELKQRSISRFAKINGKRFKDEVKNFTDEETQRLTNAANHIGSLPLFIDDTPGITIEYLVSQSKRLKRENPNLSLIVIDYLTLMDITPRKGETYSKAVGRVTNRLKRLARELKVPIILLAQLNRSIETRANKTPQLSDLRESGEIEQDADVIGFLHKEEELQEIKDEQILDHIELTIAKGRSIGVNKFKFSFNGAIQTFREK